jgi:hypothetical protein
LIPEVGNRWQQEAARENRWHAVGNRESEMRNGLKEMETRARERENGKNIK